MSTPNSACPEAEIILLDPEDYRRSQKEDLERAGYTYQQLQEQAKADEFESASARLTWLMVRET